MSDTIVLGKPTQLTFTDPCGDVTTFQIVQGFLHVERKFHGTTINADGWELSAIHLPQENAVALRDMLDGYIKLFANKK